MDTATEIQKRGIPLDDAPCYYGSPSFFERLSAEFMLSGYAVPRSPGDMPQMIPLDLRQEKCVRSGCAICDAAAGLAFDEVKALHFSEVTPVGFTEALAAVGMIPGVYYPPGQVPVHVFRHEKTEPDETKTEPTETKTQGSSETPDPKPSRRWKHTLGPIIREVIQLVLAEGNSLQDAKVDKKRYPIIEKRVRELHPKIKSLSFSSVYNELRYFKF